MAGWIRETLRAAPVGIGLPLVIGAASIKPDDAVSNLSKWAEFFGVSNPPAWLVEPAADGRVIAATILLSMLYLIIIWGVPRFRQKKSIMPIYIMFIGLVIFVIGAVLHFHYKKADTISNSVQASSEEDITASERLRRNFLLTDLRTKYLNENPNANQRIFAGLEDVPDEWINARLTEVGEKWKVDHRKIEDAAGPGIFVQVEDVPTPIDPIDKQINFASVTGVNVKDYIGSIAALRLANNDAYDFGLQKHQPVTKITVSNYSDTAITNVALGAEVTFSEIVKDIDNNNALKSGAVAGSHPISFFIKKIDAGKSYIFFIINHGKHIQQYIFDDKIRAKPIGATEPKKYSVETNISFPVAVWPVSID